MKERSKVLPWIDRKVSSVESGLNLLGTLVILFLMFFVTLEVVGRYFFNHPVQGHYEIVVLLMAPVVFLGMAYTEQIGGHITMDLVISRVPRGPLRYGLEILMLHLSLAVIGLFVFQGFKYMLFTYEIGLCTDLMSYKYWPMQLIVVIGLFFSCAYVS